MCSLCTNLLGYCQHTQWSPSKTVVCWIMLCSIIARLQGRCCFALWDVKEHKKRWRGRKQWSSAILRSQAWRKYHFSIGGDQSELLMCYTSWAITASRRPGTAEGETHWRCTCRGIRSISCTWKHFPKSAVVGEEDGAVQRKAPAGFLPVHRCPSPHIRLIQSHRHQMPWECQTQPLKRQRAQRRTQKHRHNKGVRTFENNPPSLLKCRRCSGLEDGSYTEYAPSKRGFWGQFSSCFYEVCTFSLWIAL